MDVFESERVIRDKKFYKSLKAISEIVSGKDIPLYINLSNSCYTNNKAIYLGVADFFSKETYDKVDLVAYLKGADIHESSHIKYSNFEVFKDFLKDVYKKYKTKPGCGEYAVALTKTAKLLNNALEDGRIEFLDSMRFYNHINILKYLRGIWYNENYVRLDEKTKRDEVQDMIISICSIATVGIPSSNWELVYGGTENDKLLAEVTPYIKKAVLCPSHKELSKVTMEILDILEAFLIKRLKKDNVVKENKSCNSRWDKYEKQDSVYECYEDSLMNDDPENNDNNSKSSNESEKPQNSTSKKGSNSNDYENSKSEDSESDDKGDNSEENSKNNTETTSDSSRDDEYVDEEISEEDLEEKADEIVQDIENEDGLGVSKNSKGGEEEPLTEEDRDFYENIKVDKSLTRDEVKKEYKEIFEEISEEKKPEQNFATEYSEGDFSYDTIEVRRYNLIPTVSNNYEDDIRFFRYKINSILMQKKSNVIKNKRSGRLDSNSLWKTALKDNNVFERVKKGKESNFCISILVDSSGSMHGELLFQAQKTCIILEEVLKDIVPLQIAFFSNEGRYHLHKIVKDFDQVAPKGSYVNSYEAIANGRNKDGKHIEYAIEELNKRNEENKFLIVLSDGLPSMYTSQNDGVKDVKQQVKKGKKLGIETICIAIGLHLNQIMERKRAYREMYDNLIFAEDKEIYNELAYLIQKLF